ncbi:MAG: hypothetical protein JKY93_02325 [Gammaproteobacteria bacterium]|nr:hypothetical protein [Gammaproteobacteria bacterium]
MFNLTKLLAFIPLNKTALIAVFLLMAATISAGTTWKISAWKYGQQIEAMQNAAWQAHVQALDKKNERELYRRQVAQARTEAYETRRLKQQVVTKYISREIIKYVKNPNAGKCDLPNGWVQPHDAAARNAVPGQSDATGEPDDAPSGITDIEALGVVTENYQTCHLIRDQLIELQLWAKAISGGQP